MPLLVGQGSAAQPQKNSKTKMAENVERLEDLEDHCGYCTQCGGEIKREFIFCPQCGLNIRKRYLSHTVILENHSLS